MSIFITLGMLQYFFQNMFKNILSPVTYLYLLIKM